MYVLNDRAKSFDGFLPLGPSLVSPRAANPDAMLIATRLNDDVVQQSSTEDMVFSAAELIAFLSESTTLLPGTVIATGTPAGVGYTRDPPRYLKPGDVVQVELEHVGHLRNVVE